VHGDVTKVADIDERISHNFLWEVKKMAHVIVDTCTKDGLCVDACPTEVIHPKKEEAEFEEVSQLYINQDECIDCGACVSVCPTNSIFSADELPEEKKKFVEKNAEYYKK
jgi:ferredoxin